MRKREREVVSGHGEKNGDGWTETERGLWGRFLKGRTLGSAIEDEGFFFLFGSDYWRGAELIESESMPSLLNISVFKPMGYTKTITLQRKSRKMAVLRL